MVFKFLSTPKRRKFKLIYLQVGILLAVAKLTVIQNTPGELLAAVASDFLLMPGTEVVANETDEEYESKLGVTYSTFPDRVVSSADATPITVYSKHLSTSSKATSTSSPHSHWIVVEDSQGAHHTGFQAFVEICRVSPLLILPAYLLEIRAFNAIYHIVSF